MLAKADEGGRGGGVSQMPTIADEGGRGGKLNADHCWQGVVGVRKKFQQKEFTGTKNVVRKNNWFKFNNIC